jgi:chromosome segregation ATPase
MLEAKEREILEMSEFIKVFQSAVQKLTNLNTDLLGNIEKLNTDAQLMNAKLHEANIKAARTSELQNALDEYMNLNYDLGVKNAKLMTYSDSLTRFIKVSDWVVENLLTVENHSKAREESLNKAQDSDIPKEMLETKLYISEIISSLFTIRTSLLNSVPKVSEEDKTTEGILRHRNIELEEELKKILKETNEVKSKEDSYIRTIESLKQNIELSSIEHSSTIRKMKSELDEIKSVMGAFNARMEDIKKQQESDLKELHTSRSKIVHLNSKQDHFMKKIKELKDNEASLKSENSELKNKIMNYAAGPRNGSQKSVAEDLKVKKAMSQLQILREELFRKDTDLVKKARESIKLEKDIEAQKSNVQRLHSKMKTIESEIISKVSMDLEEKDRQIEILKEMLRCAHSDIKFKDSQINSLKNSDRMTSPRRK